MKRKFIVALGILAFLEASFLSTAQTNEKLIASINQKNKDTVEVLVQKFDEDVVRVNIYGRTGV